MSRRRTVEYSPHYSPEPERPLVFGEPIPKKPRRSRGISPRRPLLKKPTPAPSYELGLVPIVVPQEVTPLVERGWEIYVIDKGTGTQEIIKGRSYTIGVKHRPVDVYSFPPDKPEGVRVGTVRMARIIALKSPEKPKKRADYGEQPNKAWTDIVVLKGVSKRPVEEPMLFDNGYGQSMIVQAQWKDIRRNR